MLNAFFTRHVKLFLLLAGLLLWIGFTRPLPLHVTSAIPFTHRVNQASEQVQGFVPGDHVQLLYHFWLCRDMAAGRTPAFSNVYEFNSGTDEGHRKFDPYYVPYSLVYALVSPFLGHAAGWNAAGLFSVLLGLFGFFALSRRFTRSVLLAAAVSLVATAFPYRWICLLGGSPTGFAASLVPWLAYGLDRAVREESWQGGLVAGLALFASYCSDLHVFAFSALTAPCWCLFSWLVDGRPVLPDGRRARHVILALLPFAGLALLAVALSFFASDTLDKSTMSEGRTLRELALFSPIKSGVFRWETLEGGSNQIFMGVSLFLLLLLGAAVRAFAWKREREAGQHDGGFRHGLAIVLLVLAVGAVFLLALGTNGPFHALPIKAARKFIPKYTMIRQTAKIFCLMPVCLTILGTLLFAPLADAAKRKRRIVILASLLAAATIAEQMLWFRPGICRLPETAVSYELAAKDAAVRGETAPRGVAIPLWPGDSHWSSAYEFGIMHSRIRLLNGYSPSVPGGYFTNIFSRLESLNQGVLSDAQRALLLDAGIEYLFFHEQPYPPKVSPFPAQIAEERLRSNPFLEPLSMTNAVWAFRVKRTPREEAPAPVPPGIGTDVYEAYPASVHWPASRIAGRGNDPGTATNCLLHLRAPVASAPSMRYKVLASGQGLLRSDSGREVAIPGGPAPVWTDLPFTPPRGEDWHVAAGRPVLRYALLVAGEEATLRDAKARLWPAAFFFHQGVSSPETGSVRFTAADVARGMVLYGPDIPLPPGRYRARLVSAPPGGPTKSPAGEFLVTTLGETETILARTGVIPGIVSETDFDYDGLAPLRLALHFHRTSDITVQSIELIGR